MTKKSILLMCCLCLAIVTIITGCNTTKGVGKDIKAAGNTAGNAVEKASGK